jgi:signal transduction histidine kinase
MSNVAILPNLRHDDDEFAREAEILGRLDEQRLQIARELHDVVAHSFATINVQAGVAARVLDDRPKQVPEALDAIRRASEEALIEFRRILGGLRQADDAADAVPSLGRLDSLAESITSAGVPTRVFLRGRPRPLPIEVDRAAYRIVQESLTNVLRHAQRASARVVVSYARHWLLIAIDDDGRPRPGRCDEGTGNGIRGMRERAERLGGELHASTGPDGGYRVWARLPLSPHR